MNFSDPSWRVATGGIKHGDFVTFGEAFVKLISWYFACIWRSSFALRDYGVMSPPTRFATTAGQGKANFGFWILDFGFWIVDGGLKTMLNVGF